MALFRLPSHKVGALVASEQRGGATKCKETSQDTDKGACVHGLQGLNMYGSATETGEHKSPALQAGGPSSSLSGLDGRGAKYIETHIGEWGGGFYSIGRQVSHPLFHRGSS